ncbi:uncharacterized protein CC84DRAFT_1177089 [Paraphaeosphaeria sporulosa]|uniref:Uncharacterized protein n=1 Tax=Paraphaeosphaeria sporulosa TaxID=1460663 RepID=A0A177CE11_9PLEO|nr:uncharacterized protein CC84DRAFT_1177089 [Paraphaeosphaeria sporulosa]OAG04960.1 hypothetical protein CC84DRAFT_1177089 [Paraphaeosphaeria sporulosa]
MPPHHQKVNPPSSNARTLSVPVNKASSDTEQTTTSAQITHQSRMDNRNGASSKSPHSATEISHKPVARGYDKYGRYWYDRKILREEGLCFKCGEPYHRASDMNALGRIAVARTIARSPPLLTFQYGDAGTGGDDENESEYNDETRYHNEREREGESEDDGSESSEGSPRQEAFTSMPTPPPSQTSTDRPSGNRARSESPGKEKAAVHRWVERFESPR